MTNNGKDFLFTSESVTEGHPDKIADQISDSVLDAILKNDPKGRVACEVLVTTGVVFISGQITTSAYVDMTQLAREIVKEIGYTDAKTGFDYETCSVMTSIVGQSPDIAMGVDATPEQRSEYLTNIQTQAQGMMTSYTQATELEYGGQGDWESFVGQYT